MTFTAEDGPQDTAAAAYQHAAALVEAVLKVSRDLYANNYHGPRYVRIEYVEHLAAGLAARAEEAKRAEEAES